MPLTHTPLYTACLAEQSMRSSELSVLCTSTIGGRRKRCECRILSLRIGELAEWVDRLEHTFARDGPTHESGQYQGTSSSRSSQAHSTRPSRVMKNLAARPLGSFIRAKRSSQRRRTSAARVAARPAAIRPKG
jgi:hypothetical protein